ncbi:MAG: hypothetical protein IRY91_05940 [Gemmatimonadaceae bacterium]|nr:hypothetical protein [Gemmatimonadaceae bacterium]
MQRVLWMSAAIVGAIAATLFFSIIRPRLEPLLSDVRARLRAVRDGVPAVAARVIGGRYSAFLDARAHDPRAPVLIELTHLSTAVETIGERQLETLRDIEGRIGRHVAALERLNTPAQRSDAQPQDVEEAFGSTSVIGLVTLIGLSLVLGLVNASLLGIFFVEVIGPESIFKYPLPNIPRGYVLAFLMFIVEVAAGWAIYRSGTRARADGWRGAGAGFFRWAPWALLLALAVVEVAAYSLLSQRVDLPHRLGLDPNGPMYGLAQYFLAFLGLGLTLLLAYLGHAIAEGLDERRRTKVARDLVGAIRRGKRTAVEHAEKVADLVGRCVQTARTLPESMPEAFRRGLGGGEMKEAALQTVKRATILAVASAEPERIPAGLLDPNEPMPVRIRVRTAPQVLADVLVDTLFLAILAVDFALTSLAVLAYLEDGSVPVSPTVAWAIAIALPAAIVGMAVGAWNVLKGLRFASPVTAALPERRSRVIFGWVLVGGLAVADLLLATLLAASAGPSRSVAVYALLGVLQGVALSVFAGWLDRGLLAVAHGLYLVCLGLARVGAWALAGLAILMDVGSYVIILIVRILAIPGDVIRRRPLPAAITDDLAKMSP